MTDPIPAARQAASRGTPLWVKISLALVLVAVLAVVAMKVFGVGMQHGPGRHGQGPIGPALSAPSAEAPHAAAS